jgi:hypothetical protein
MEVGTKVTWTSQSKGVKTTKCGTVAAVVPRGGSPKRTFAAVSRTLDVRSAIGSGLPREHESYLVSVDVGKTDKAKPALYWPPVNQLRRADECVS